MIRPAGGGLLPRPNGRLLAKEGVYASLKSAILSGKLKQGSPLVERHLADEYRLSRTPVREILRRLEREELVELIPNRGAFVRPLTARQVGDIFWAREAVEGIAARLTATGHAAEELQCVEHIFEGLKVEDRPAALARMVQAGLRLHDFIVRATDNRFLQHAYDGLRNQAVLIRSMTQQSFAIEHASFHDHVRIIEAIREREPRLAELAMRSHLRATRQRLLRQLFH
jgi:DNA-binding GntR family transcriptional regulator